MVKRENNLLDNSETGWGKHIEIYQGGVIEESEIVELFDIGCIPFFITRQSISYLVIIGSDLTCGLIKEDEDGKVLTAARVSEIITQLDWALCEVFAYLKWDKAELKIDLIGKLGDLSEKLFIPKTINVLQTNKEPAKPVKDENLLVSNLQSYVEGHREYAEIYKNRFITEKEVIDYHEKGYVPFFIFIKGEMHLAVLKPKLTKPFILPNEVGKVLHVKRVSAMVAELDSFLDKIYKSLGWKRKDLTVLLIGKHSEKEKECIIETRTF